MLSGHDDSLRLSKVGEVCVVDAILGNANALKVDPQALSLLTTSKVT
jgi:hypothetical protein